MQPFLENLPKAEFQHPCGRGNSTTCDAWRRCAFCQLKTIPIPVKIDRQGHSCNFYVGFGLTDPLDHLSGDIFVISRISSVSQLSWLERSANNRKVRGSSPRGTTLLSLPECAPNSVSAQKNHCKCNTTLKFWRTKITATVAFDRNSTYFGRILLPNIVAIHWTISAVTFLS